MNRPLYEVGEQVICISTPAGEEGVFAVTGRVQRKEIVAPQHFDGHCLRCAQGDERWMYALDAFPGAGYCCECCLRKIHKPRA